MITFHVLSLFPELIEQYCKTSIIGRGAKNSLIKIKTVNPRDFCQDNYRRVDDKPYGGGAGMVLKPEPYFLAIESLQLPPITPIIILSPQGQVYHQAKARQLANFTDIVLIAGHYEGFDDRIKTLANYEFSIGDYILTGGELPALVIIDSIARLIPGVLGKAFSLENESFNQDLLEGPQYTRPPSYRGLNVPPVLLSGNHAQIALWRKQQAIRQTLKYRSDLLSSNNLSKSELNYIEEVKKETEHK